MQDTIRACMERPMHRVIPKLLRYKNLDIQSWYAMMAFKRLPSRSQPGDRKPSQDQWLPGAAAVPVDGHPDVVPFPSTAIGTCGTISA